MKDKIKAEIAFKVEKIMFAHGEYDFDGVNHYDLVKEVTDAVDEVLNKYL